MHSSIARYPKFRGDSVIEFEEQTVPTPGPGQLLVQCKANALCASDLGGFRRGSTVTMGHEIAGVVVQAGRETKTAVGTPGVVFLMDFCGACRSCRLGLTNQCLQKRADYGFNRDGGYGPYTLINENVFFPIDADIPFDEATMLLDIMGTGGHALTRGHLIHPDVTSLLVNGSGPIGLGIWAMAKLRFGAGFPVLITDLVPYRLELAEELGGLPINVATGSLADGLARHGFTTVDLAIDATGKTVARRAALDLLAKRGVLVCVGHGEGLDLTVSPDLIATERAILGSEYFCYNELAANLDLLRQHRGYLGQIITHRYPVAELGAAFAQFIFNHRYAKPIQLAQAAIDSGRLGEINFVSWRFGGEGSSDHPHANLIETQCHAFDQIETLCGPIDSVMAQMTDKTGMGYRTLVLALHFTNGAVGSLLGSYDASYAYPDTHLLEINGSAGRILVEDTVRRYSFQARGSETAEVWQAGYFNDRDREFHRTFDRHFDALLTAFKQGDPPPVHAAAGRRALVLAHAAIASFEWGERVAVPAGG